jgi:hypothetical protein
MAKEHEINASSNGASSNGFVNVNDIIERGGPYADTLRELVAEGYEPDQARLAQLRAVAATWPE